MTRSGQPSLRMTWAVLASLLLHLMIIGDLAHLQWWRAFSSTGMPPALDVHLAPTASPEQQVVDPVAEQSTPAAQPEPLPQPELEPETLAAPPTPEISLAEPPPTPPEQALTANPQAVTAQLNVKPNEDSISRRLPPNGKLVYLFYWGKSRWLAGQAVHQWVIEKDAYSVTSTVSTTGLFQLLHPLKMIETSYGKVSGEILRPTHFSTQLNEYPPAVARFDWGSGHYRWQRGSSSFIQVMPKNSYDKISYLYQLYLAARKENYFSAEITLGRHLEHYDILNLGMEEIEIDGKFHQSIHLRRATPSPEMEKVDIWLASHMDHLPLKMTYANQAGDHFEQLISGDSLPAHQQ